jgi:MFS family permease
MGRIPHNVEALLAALQFRNASPEKLQELPESQWPDLLSFCDLMHLTLPLGQVCDTILPTWVRQRIEKNFVDNSLRFVRIKAVYSELASALRNAGLECLVIKGFAQCPDYVANARLRLQSDVDLFCPLETVYRARDVIAELGYWPDRRLDHLPSDHLPPMARATNCQWQGNFFDPEIPVGVELHFRLWDDTSTRFLPPGLDLFWNRRVARHMEEITFLGLSPEDNLAYISLHLLRNMLRGEWILHYVYEVARFLHANAGNDAFWQNWQDLHDASLRSLEAIAFRLARTWFACDVSEQVTDEIANLTPPVRQWFQQFSDSPLTGIFHPNKDGLWLHMALLESARDRAAVLREKLMPSRVPPMGAPGQGTTVEGKPKRFWPAQRHAKYGFYLASRVFHHVRTLPPTLARGLRWWWAGKGLDGGFWTFFAASFCLDFGGFIFFVLYNLYMVDRGASEKLLGWVTSASALGTLAGTIPAGLLAHRFGLRRAMLLCFAAVPVLSALRTVMVSEVPQLTLAFLTGAAMSIWAVCISPALAQLTDEKNRAFAFSLVFSSGIGVGVLGGLFGGLLPGWLGKILSTPTSAHVMQLALLISCGIVGLGLLPAARLRLPVIPIREKKFYPRNRFLPRFLLAIGLWSLVTGSLGPFFNIYFSRYLHMSVPRVGMVFSLAQISQVVAILLAPLIYKRFGLITGIMYTQIATALALGCLAAVPIASAAVVMYTGYMAFLWMSEPGMYSLLMSEVAPSERSGASALNFFVISLASAIAAAAAGQGFARFGYPPVMGVTAVVALVAAVAFRVLLSNAVTAPSAQPVVAPSDSGDAPSLSPLGATQTPGS